MNPATNTTSEMIPLTEAIVTAAKPTRVRKPNTPSIVDEIISDLRSGKYTQESLATLARLFNREFVAEPLNEKKSRKSKKDAPVVTDEDAPAPAPSPKEKKPRKSKKDAVVVTDEEAPTPAPQEKKPRTSKKDAPVVTEEDASAVTDKEAPAPAPKEKKPRKSKKDAPVVTEEEAPVPKEKKPRKSKKDAPVVTEEEAPAPSKEKNVTPLLEPEDDLPDLESRLEGFLEEEELSDIELDDDDE